MPRFVPGENSLMCLSEPLLPGQNMEVHFIRSADWDAHWAMVFRGASGVRWEIRRFCSYSEARKEARRYSAMAAGHAATREPIQS